MGESQYETQQVLFSGKVQGVGFRWTTTRFAKRYKLTGWVKNLPDGRVEMLPQATPDDIDSLIADLASHFGTGITSVERHPVAETPAFSDFSIQR